MAFLAGQRITAAALNRLQPNTYEAVGTTSQDGPITNVPVTDCTVTFTTGTDFATAVVNTVFDFDFLAATTTLCSGRLYVDGVGESRYAVFQQGPGTASDLASVAQNYHVVLGTAGSHTLNLAVTLPTGVRVQGLYTSLVATIYEAV